MNRCLSALALIFCMGGALAQSTAGEAVQLPSLPSLPNLPVETLPAAGPFPETPRPFPKESLKGKLSFDVFPVVRLNGEPAQLAPGARIRGQNHLVVMPSTLTGQTHWVNYTRDLSGQVLDVWILRRSEAEREWPRHSGQTQRWTFDAVNSTWSR